MSKSDDNRRTFRQGMIAREQARAVLAEAVGDTGRAREHAERTQRLSARAERMGREGR